MKPALNDLRLLKLAEMYELSYERFLIEIAQRVVKDDDARAELMKLVDPKEDHHAQIVAELDRLNSQLSPEDQASVEIAALQDVLEVETAARDFYIQRVDQLHDPRLVSLFKNLARAEDDHVRVARHALALAEQKAGRAGTGHKPERLRVVPEDILFRDV